MHGGAKGSGGQPGNQHALKNGRYSTEAVQERLGVGQLIRTLTSLMGTSNHLEVFHG